MSNKSLSKTKRGVKNEFYPTPEDREESNRLTSYYLWKRKAENRKKNKDEWFEEEDSFDDSFSDSLDK